MNTEEDIHKIYKNNLWKKFFNKLTTGFSTIISFLLQNPLSSRTWVARNEEEINRIDRTLRNRNYRKSKDPIQSDLDLNVGHQLLTYQAMQINIRVSEIEPPPGYAKVLRILQSQSSRID